MTFGSAAGAYTFTDAGSGGVIDAHTDTGGVETWLAFWSHRYGQRGANVYWWTRRRHRSI